MEEAGIVFPALRLDGEAERRPGCQHLRVEPAALGGGRVRNQVLVDPHDGVADMDSQARRRVAGRVDRDGVGDRLRPTRQHGAEPAGRGDGDRPEGDDRAAPPVWCHSLAPPSDACTFFACSKCATNAGRTLTSKAFKSAFDALGISTLSTASSTAAWYATS